jgi:hypothetical protein
MRITALEPWLCHDIYLRSSRCRDGDCHLPSGPDFARTALAAT